MYSIGELARASGLTASALRFYDKSGLLVPAETNRSTGYRWYSEEQLIAARLLASLRRANMPLAEIRRLMRRPTDKEQAWQVLDRHVRRLEEGLTGARRELAQVWNLLGTQEMQAQPATRWTMSSAELRAALRSVSFAVGTDPTMPALCGVLVEVQDGSIRLVASDRHRLAVAHAPAHSNTGPPVTALVPTALFHEADDLLASNRTVTMVVDRNRVTVQARERQISMSCLEHDFPNYRQALPVVNSHRVVVDVEPLRAGLVAAAGRGTGVGGVRPAPCVSVLALDRAGMFKVAKPDAALADARLKVAVNSVFLMQALDALGRDQLVLELDGPVTPLTIRLPDTNSALSVLMPVRL
ncbi:MerR family transcriptional regulator [Streptomyces lavenduligriseus]|nr:MerR family transcriptional regulator [Streptomyces lavenduligriseus]